MRQRLGIAAALLGDPGVLMFDEPVNGLDLDGVRWIRALLRGWADEGRTVLVSSHLMSEMQMVADRVVVIGRGRLIADATVDEVLRGLDEQRVSVRTPYAEDLGRALAARGAVVERLGPEDLDVVGLAAVRGGHDRARARRTAAPAGGGRAVARAGLPAADRGRASSTVGTGAAREGRPMRTAPAPPRAPSGAGSGASGRAGSWRW